MDGYVIKSYKGIDVYFEKGIFEKKEDLENTLIKKRIDFLNSEIERSLRILGNPNFISKAKREKVKEEKDKLSLYQNELKNLLLKLNGK